MSRENQETIQRGFSLRSVILIVLIVAMGAGATVYALGHTFAVSSTPSNSQTQQTTSSTTAGTTAHNCTLASLSLTTG